MKVIFNADDFGLSKGVNYGIIDSFLHGPVRSTTLMAGGAAFEHAVELAKLHPKLGVGAHLQLTASQSVGGPYKTLTDKTGRFHSLVEMTKRAEEGLIDLQEVEAEYHAQMQKILSTGITIDHLDSHHHSHHLPGVMDVFFHIAKEYHIPLVRMADKALLNGIDHLRTIDRFDDRFYLDQLSIDTIRTVLEEFPEGSVEFMCHPAYIDQALCDASSYALPRMKELNILTSVELQNLLYDKCVDVCKYTDID